MLKRRETGKFVVKSSITFLIFLLHFFSAKALADLPITVENLLTENDELKLSFNVSYASADTSKVSLMYQKIDEIDKLDTSNNKPIQRPKVVGEERTNSDKYFFTLGGRYGLSDTTEIYSRISAVANDIRTYSDNHSNSLKSKQLNQFIIGVNFQFYDDTYSSALLSFAELTLFENTARDGSKYVFFKAGKFGLTAHKAIDPVVLSISAGLHHRWLREVNNKDINPSDLLFINPNFRFSMNNEVTLTGGVQFNFRTQDIVDDEWTGIRKSQTDLELGIDYASSEKLTFNLTITTDVSGYSGAQANIGWRYKLGN
jgi:hypothetical protein